MKKEKILIVGKSGSGKDFLRKGLEKKGLVYLPKFTTRPKREGEVENVDYTYLNNEQFHEMEKNNEILFSQRFHINDNLWIYGMTIKSYIDSQIIIITPFELSSLNNEYLKNVFVVYLDIDIDIRKERISERYDNNDSIMRRINLDEIDFQNIDYDLKITDPNFDIDMVYGLMY